MHKHLASLFMLIGTLLLSGCFQDAPTEADMTRQLTAKVEQDTLGALTVASVTKQNGFKPDDKHYRAELAITYRVVKTPEQLAAELKQDLSQNPLAGFVGSLALGALKVQLGNRKVGDTFTETKAFEFIKTEQGWQLSRPIDHL